MIGDKSYFPSRFEDFNPFYAPFYHVPQFIVNKNSKCHVNFWKLIFIERAFEYFCDYIIKIISCLEFRFFPSCHNTLCNLARIFYLSVFHQYFCYFFG